MAALALAGLVVVPAGPAAAEPAGCSIVAPTKIRIDQRYRAVPMRLAADCAASGAVYASWQVVHPTQGLTEIAIFDGTTTDTWDLSDWEPTGRYTVRPSSAWDVDHGDLAQNTATTTVKLGSRLTATTTRDNAVLRFSAVARTYSPKLSTWYPRAGAKVSLMYRAPGSPTWRWVKAASTGRTGGSRCPWRRRTAPID